MKKLLIILGLVIMLCLIGITIYLLFLNEDTGEEGFGLISLGDTTDENVSLVDFLEESDEPSTVDVTSDEPLIQLTTRPVIAHHELTFEITASSTGTTTSDYIYYIEKGSGHLFSIDLLSGEEIRLSNITIPKASEGAISANGESYAVRSGTINRDLYLIDLKEGDPQSIKVAENVKSFVLLGEDLVYAVEGSDSVVAYRFFPLENRSEVLFETPFAEAAIAWGETIEGPHLMYPTPSAELPGYLYSYENGARNRLAGSGYGLIAFNEEVQFYTVKKDGEYRTYTNQGTPLFLAFLPKKCASATNYQMICGHGELSSNRQFPDVWYSGEYQFNDTIVIMDVLTNSLREAIEPISLVGRGLDIINPDFSPETDSFYFVNKLDNTLWRARIEL